MKYIAKIKIVLWSVLTVFLNHFTALVHRLISCTFAIFHHSKIVIFRLREEKRLLKHFNDSRRLEVLSFLEVHNFFKLCFQINYFKYTTQFEFPLEGAREHDELNNTYIMIKKMFTQMHDYLFHSPQPGRGRLCPFCALHDRSYTIRQAFGKYLWCPE